MSESVQQHFDRVAGDYDAWKEKAHFYYATLKGLLQEVVERGASVCEVGCGTGDILASLGPSYGVGYDLSPEMVRLARLKHPHLTFQCEDIETLDVRQRFRYVIAVDVVEHVHDLDKAFSSMGRLLDEQGILIVTTANPLWGPALHAAESLGLKMPEGEHQWRSRRQLSVSASRADLVELTFRRAFIIPKRIPLLKALNEVSWASGLRQRLGLIQRATYARA